MGKMAAIKKTLSKLSGGYKLETPVCDKYIYDGNFKSFCGGSLSESNVLVLTNGTNDNILFDEWAEQEHMEVRLLQKEDDSLSAIDIKKYSNDLIGPFTHIINLVSLYGRYNNANNKSNSNEYTLRLLYQWLQVESDYLIRLNQTTSICSIIDVKDDGLLATTEEQAISSLISGLGLALGKHSVITNGVSVRNNDIRNALNLAGYLSSKYGYLMAGEVLKMD